MTNHEIEVKIKNTINGCINPLQVQSTRNWIDNLLKINKLDDESYQYLVKEIEHKFLSFTQ